LTPPILDIDLSKLSCDESTRLVIQQLLNYIEYQHKETLSLKHENQQLKDEINRLKGEQGKPDISPNTKHQGTNISSEVYSREKKKWKKRAKKSIIKVDNHLHCPLEKEGLPPDLQFKGREHTDHHPQRAIPDILVKILKPFVSPCIMRWIQHEVNYYPFFAAWE